MGLAKTMRTSVFQFLFSSIVAIGLLATTAAYADFDAELKKCKDQLQAKQPDAAIQACTTALKSNPPSPDGKAFAHHLRGIAYAQSGQFDPAIQDFNEVMRIKPNSGTLLARGNAFARKGDLNRAMDDFEKAFTSGGEEGVKQLQTHLKSNGKYTGAVDGKYGPGTRKALEACVRDPKC
jgi:tetratricopeptide (TPR) repeat protein